jgi:hypothetical protein
MTVGDSLVTQPAPLAAHIHTRLPKVWVGYVLALVIFVLLLPSEWQPYGSSVNRLDLSAVGLILFVVGWIYWLFCVHRIHRALREATNGSYSISPRRAVGFQFIPLYSLIWLFKWPKRIAEFVNSRGGSKRMPRFLPGIVLLLAAFMGQFGPLAALHLLILFAVAHYIIRKLGPHLPRLAPETVVVRRREHQFNLAMSAGVGAVFSFKIFQAFWNPLNHESPKELFHEILAITLVSCGVILFIEPLAETWRSRLGLQDHHAHIIGRPRMVKFMVFSILALTSLAHGFLHKQIEGEMQADPVRAIIGIAGATLVSGGITYAWVSGACRQKPRAARFGLATGAVIGLLVVSLVLVASKAQHPKEEAIVTQQPSDAVAQGVGEAALPVSPTIVLNARKNYQNPKIRAQWELDLRKIILPWTILGLIGGLAVDRKWGRRASRSVALTIFASGALLFPVFALLAHRLSILPLPKEEVLAHILAVGGWALSLSVFPFADKLLTVGHVPSNTALQSGVNQQPAA